MRIFKFIIVILIALSIGLILGYNYKKPNERMLASALNESSQWKKEILLEKIKARTDFFELDTNKPFIGEDGKKYFSGYGSFHFNWFAFFISVISIVLLYVIAEKTILIDLLKSKIKTYLK